MVAVDLVFLDTNPGTQFDCLHIAFLWEESLPACLPPLPMSSLRTETPLRVRSPPEAECI